MSADPSFSGKRKASYTPNGDDSATSGEPKVLKYDQHDSTREVTKVNADRNANVAERSCCRTWWTRPKIIVAILVLVIILLLVIILPSVLVPMSRSEDSSQVLESQQKSDIVYVKGNLTAQIIQRPNGPRMNFLDFIHLSLQRNISNETAVNTGGNESDRHVRVRREPKNSQDPYGVEIPTTTSFILPFYNMTASTDEERAVLVDLSHILKRSAESSQLCHMISCQDVVPEDFAISHSALYMSFFLGVNRTSLGDFHLDKETIEQFDQAIEANLTHFFSHKYEDYRMDDLSINFDFDRFCANHNLSCFVLPLLNLTIPAASDLCQNSGDPNCTTVTANITESPRVGEVIVDEGSDGHNDSIVGSDILIVVRNASETIESRVEVVTIPATLPPLPSFVMWPSALDNCTANGFVCSNQRQRVSTSQRCNGFKDCEDGSDEENCARCLTSFYCPTGTNRKQFVCLNSSLLCDGNPDCPTAMDESPIYCKAVCLPGIEYKCKTADICIPMSFLCDGEPHCPGGEDEAFCTSKTQCRNGTFFCGSKCIPKWKRCDGHIDCVDGSDETDCSCVECSGDRTVMCHSGRGRCIHKSLVCNGIADCPDGEDEVNCPGWCQLETPLDMISCKDGHKHLRKRACAGLIPECDGFCDVCDQESSFRCGGRCVHRSQVCDGVPNCQDGSDEKGCTCIGSNNFRCTSEENRCIGQTQLCDGIEDCNGGEDELNCSSCANNSKGFYCAVKRKCLSSDKRCNGIVDCPDYSDEDNCSCTDCMSTMGNGTFYCRSGRRCLSRDYLCKSGGIYHCPGNPPEDITWCTRKV